MREAGFVAASAPLTTPPISVSAATYYRMMSLPRTKVEALAVLRKITELILMARPIEIGLNASPWKEREAPLTVRPVETLREEIDAKRGSLSPALEKSLQSTTLEPLL